MAQNYAIAAQKPVPKNCILRILPEQTSFDPAYYVAVPTLSGGKDVATPLWYVSDKVGYAKLFYPDAVKPGADTTGFNRCQRDHRPPHGQPALRRRERGDPLRELPAAPTPW